MTPENLRALEALVDSHGIRAVLRALAEIANGKAEHVDTNWQDGALAHMWEGVSIACMNASERPALRRLAEFEGRS